MSHPLLRLYDGFDHTSPELRDEVKALQTALSQEGFALEVDSLFGRDTESTVKRFQREHGLDPQ
jgi:N-acetyl-anhydromuramyl-L-alanine amidase AmpD